MFLPEARRAAEGEPRSVHRVLRRSGHVCNIARPALINRLCLDFMKSVG